MAAGNGRRAGKKVAEHYARKLAGDVKPDWLHHPRLGWLYTTEADMLRADRETVSAEEIARRVVEALEPNGAELIRGALERRGMGGVVEERTESGGWRVRRGI